MIVKVLCFGSLNIDLCYQVDRFAAPGETVDSRAFTRQAGGKGLNQTLALARAGARVAHAGCIGQDGLFLRDLLAENGADVTHLRVVEAATGHAVIQIDPAGQNSILLHGGANRQITAAHRAAALADCDPGDWLLLQNEINDVAALIEAGHARGMTVALNPSPFAGTEALPLDPIDWFLVNEFEAAQLAGGPGDPADRLTARFPAAAFVITQGAAGALYAKGSERCFVPACPVQAVDTTGAGDTFTGYLLAELTAGRPVQAAMELAAAAAALAVTRPGAAASIPTRAEVEARFARQRSAQ